jgi:hypothetical protein
VHLWVLIQNYSFMKNNIKKKKTIVRSIDNKKAKSSKRRKEEQNNSRNISFLCSIDLSKANTFFILFFNPKPSKQSRLKENWSKTPYICTLVLSYGHTHRILRSHIPSRFFLPFSVPSTYYVWSQKELKHIWIQICI